MATAIARVKRGVLVDPTSDGSQEVDLDSPEWVRWLQAPGRTSFSCEQDGVRFTARRERAGRYWYAYKRCGGFLHKIYLGKPADISSARLAFAASLLAAREVDSKRVGTRLHNLPAEISSFVGRERAIAELVGHLDRHRLVTLTGFGGVGKTRLAVRVAREVLAGYQDGVWLVDLALIKEPRLVAQTVATVVGVRQTSAQSTVEQLVQALHPRRMLLLLDNCEHLVDACAQLAHQLLGGCPELKLLTTSREPLKMIGEVRYAVPPLALPEQSCAGDPASVAGSEAVRLFLDRAIAVQPELRLAPETAWSISQVCSQLHGIPLALELAAARLPGRSIHDLAGRLDRRLYVLVGGVRTAPARHQTLRATLDWSDALLNQKERRLLRRLSIFVGGWTLEAAEAICSVDDIEADQVQQVLGELVERSWVVADQAESGTRYHLLEMVREYALERLFASEPAHDLGARHRDFYLQLATRRGLAQASQAQRLSQLHLELGNLRAALEWSAGRPDVAEIGLRLACGLRILWVSGLRREGLYWIDRLLDLCGANVDPSLLAYALMLGGHLAVILGQATRGRSLLERSVALWRVLADRSGLGEALAHLGTAALFAGEYELAIQLLQDGLVLSRETGLRRAEAHSLLSLATTWRMQGDHEHASQAFEQAVAVSRDIGSDGDLAMCLLGKGMSAFARGAADEAIALYLESLRLLTAINNPEGLVHVLAALAWLAIDRGQVELGAQLLGAGDAACLRGGFNLHAVFDREHKQARETARLRLGAARFAAALAFGGGLSLEPALSLAVTAARRWLRPQAAHRNAPLNKLSLSPREYEVAVLVSRGKTNAEIATVLVIAESTAASHVASILSKLGYARRSQIGAWVGRSQLHR